MRLLFPFLLTVTTIFLRLCESRQLQARVWKRSEPYYFENGRIKSSRRLYRLHSPNSGRVQAARTFHRGHRNIHAPFTNDGSPLSRSSGRFYRKIAASPTHRISPQNSGKNESTLLGASPYSEERHNQDKLRENEKVIRDSRDYAHTLGRTTMRVKYFREMDPTTTPVPPKRSERPPPPKTGQILNQTTSGGSQRSQQQVEPSAMPVEKLKTKPAMSTADVVAQPAFIQPPPSQTFTMPPPAAPQFAPLPYQQQQSQISPAAPPPFPMFAQQQQFGAPPPGAAPQFGGPLNGFQQFAGSNPGGQPPFLAPQSGQFTPPVNQFPPAFPGQLPQQPQFAQVPTPTAQPMQPPPPSQFAPNFAGAGQPQFSSPQPPLPGQPNLAANPFLPQQPQQPAQLPTQHSQLQQMMATAQPSAPSSGNTAGNSTLEAFGCAFDFVTNTCKDVFALNWCGQCHDFGNLFVHDCKCVRPLFENIPRQQQQQVQQVQQQQQQVQQVQQQQQQQVQLQQLPPQQPQRAVTFQRQLQRGRA